MIEVDDFKAMADYINSSIAAVSYHHFDSKTEEIITHIACIICPFTESDFDKEKEIIEGSNADTIVKQLIDSISTRNLESTIKNLLIEHDQFEILQDINF